MTPMEPGSVPATAIGSVLMTVVMHMTKSVKLTVLPMRLTKTAGWLPDGDMLTVTGITATEAVLCSLAGSPLADTGTISTRNTDLCMLMVLKKSTDRPIVLTQTVLYFMDGIRNPEAGITLTTMVTYLPVGNLSVETGISLTPVHTKCYLTDGTPSIV